MLQLLQRCATEFVKVVSRNKGLSPAAVEAAGGKIFPYGSYRLGVYGPGEISIGPNDFRSSILTSSTLQVRISIPLL